MATSQRAFYFIALAKALGEKIPDTWGIDSHGQPVTDPSQVTAGLLFGLDKEAFNARVDTFINNIKKARVAQGHEEIFLPGEQGERRRRKCLQEGTIELDEQAFNRLKALAQASG